jgi:hypothetical protein
MLLAVFSHRGYALTRLQRALFDQPGDLVRNLLVKMMICGFEFFHGILHGNESSL